MIFIKEDLDKCLLRNWCHDREMSLKLWLENCHGLSRPSLRVLKIAAAYVVSYLASKLLMIKFMVYGLCLRRSPSVHRASNAALDVSS